MDRVSDIKESHNCPLCNSTGQVFFQNKFGVYHQCTQCKAVYLDKEYFPSLDEERLRYQEHNNDVLDLRYQSFVSPITSAIFNQFSKTDKGLDFGAGTGPVIAQVLGSQNYNFNLFDPLFHNDPTLLKQKYNYIAACEVIEHFHNPYQEFELLKSMLLPQGRLYCMTSLYHSAIDFKTWNYKDDQTHVFIYQKETLEWIKGEFSFSKLIIENNFMEFYS